MSMEFIHKQTNQSYILETGEEFKNFFKDFLFKELYDNVDDYEDTEVDSTRELVWILEKKKFDETKFLEKFENEKGNLEYFWRYFEDIKINNVSIEKFW